DQDMARGRPGGAGKALPETDQRSDASMEVKPDGSGIVSTLVRLLQGAGFDARSHRRQACALAYRAHRRQASRPAQLHRPYPVGDSVQKDRSRQGQAAETIPQRQIRRHRGDQGTALRKKQILNRYRVAALRWLGIGRNGTGGAPSLSWNQYSRATSRSDPS